jgi:hypothetical protein
MATRLIREGIVTSDRIDKLTPAGEVFYRRLMSKVDDHGLFDGRISVIRSSLYPLRLEPDHPHHVTGSDVSAWLIECVEAGLVQRYAVDGKPFVRMLDTRWQARSAPKYPLPDGAETAPPRATENNRKQSSATVHLYEVVVVGVVVGEDVVEISARDALERIGVKPEAWQAWERHRHAIRKPLTEDAIRLQVKHLSEWAAEGHDATGIIETAIASRYQGLFKPKTGPPGRASGREPTLAEKRAATIDELTGKRTTNERTIEGSAERVDRKALRTLPGNLREPA